MPNETQNNKETARAYSPFKAAICDYLRARAKEEPSFLEKLKNPEKSIDRCLDYIVGEVQRSGRQGFDDAEIYSLAIHYYDEDDKNLREHGHIDSLKVIVNREMPFTDEEKESARKEAFERMVEDERARLRKPLTPTPTATAKRNVKKDEPMTLNLFD